MRINLNGIIMGTSGADVALNPPLRGLAIPPIRTASGNYSGRDGGWVSSQFYAVREIVLNGTVNGRSCPDAAEKLCRLQGAVRIRQGLPLYVTTGEGTTYFTQVYLAGFNMDIDNERIHTFQMTLIAPDPNFYIVDPDDPEQGWNTVEFEEVVGGGYITPYVLPVEWQPSSQPTIINNPTDQLILPQIILQGKFTNPRVTNTTTGQYIELAVTTTTGDEIVIDMKDRSIILNGGSILPSKSGSWWGLIEGDNYVELHTDSSADDKSGLIRYRPAYSGIYEGVC